MTVTLYSKPDCSLCVKVRRILETLRSEADFQVEEFDITQDPELAVRYGHVIPVVLVDGVQVACGAVAEAELRRAVFRRRP